MITQDNVREKLLEKTNAMRQQNIAKTIGVPREIISKFMNGKRDLWDSSLKALNDYLDAHWLNPQVTHKPSKSFHRNSNSENEHLIWKSNSNRTQIN